MMAISLLIAIVLLIILDHSNCQGGADKWLISIPSSNKFGINLGLYSNITITFTNPHETPTHCSGILKLSTAELQIPEGDNGISFDTSISTEIKAHIGRSFNLSSSHGAEYPFEFLITSSSCSDRITSNAFTASLTIPPPYPIELDQSHLTVRFYFFAEYTVKLIDDFYPVDNITIYFTRAPTNSPYSAIDNCTINPFPNESYLGGRYAIYGQAYIVYSQVFTAEVLDYSKYFSIKEKIKFSLTEESLATIQAAIESNLRDMRLESYNEENRLDVTSVLIPVYPTVFSCAVHCVGIQLTDEDIREQKQGAISQDKLQFYKEVIDKAVTAKMTFEGLSRYCPLKMKCFLDVNKELVPQPENFKTLTFVVGDAPKANIPGSIRLGKREFIETNCCTWLFTHPLKDKQLFNAKAVEFFNRLHTEQPIEKEQGCFNYIAKDTSNEQTAAICLIPLPKCSLMPLSDYNELFNKSISLLSTTEKLANALGLNAEEYTIEQIMHESDAYRYNNSAIQSTLIEVTTESVSFSVSTLGLPALCTVRKVDQMPLGQLYEEEFYDSQLQGSVYPNKSTLFTVPFKIAPLQGVIYSVYMNCLNLPQFDHYHYYHYFPVITFYYTNDDYPLPEKEPLENCGIEGQVYKPHCIKKKRVEYPSMDYGWDITLYNVNYENFKHLNISQQLLYVSKQEINKTAFSKEDLFSLSDLSSYLSLINCLNYPSYSRCRKAKMDIHHSILAKLNSTYRTIYRDTLPDYDDINEAFRYHYTTSLFYLASNYDLFTPADAKDFMDLIFGYVDEFQDIMYRFLSGNKTSIITLYTGILDIFIDMMHFIEIEKGFNEESINTTTRVVNDTYKVRLKRSIEKILPFHKKYDAVSNVYSNFIYNFYLFCSQGDGVEERESVGFMDNEATQIDIPSYYVSQFKVRSFLAIIYSSFPLLSYNNSLTYWKVLSLRAYDSSNNIVNVTGMPANISIVYYRGEKFPWKYCGTFNETSLDVTYNDIHTLNDGKEAFQCNTSFFSSDYILTTERYIANPDTPSVEEPMWMYIAIGVGAGVIVIAIGIGVGCCVRKRKRVKVEDKMNISLTDLMK